MAGRTEAGLVGQGCDDGIIKAKEMEVLRHGYLGRARNLSRSQTRLWSKRVKLIKLRTRSYPPKVVIFSLPRFSYTSRSKNVLGSTNDLEKPSSTQSYRLLLLRMGI